MEMNRENIQVAVVIPAFKVRAQIESVIRAIGGEVDNIYVVDDCCPDGTADFVKDVISDCRVTIIKLEENLGVGGAVIAGYKKALEDGCDIIVKVDGDGQMKPELIPDFITPILAGDADYTKGNRFFNLEGVRSMPKMRIFGNSVLSFMSKLSTGYWNVFDPTNGYTAISSSAARKLPFEKISKRYFFETDMLFRLNIIRAVVEDVPMDSVYGDEESNLHIREILGEFIYKHINVFIKRIFYNYYLRGMSAASLELPLGIFLLLFGCVFGSYSWIAGAATETAASSGTVMLSGLPIILGVQLILAFINYDVSAVPKKVLRRFV